MAKHRNQRIYSKNHDWLKMLASEQEEYIGRDYKLDLRNDCLTIFALPQKRRKSKKGKRGEPRNKRAESAARNER